MGENTPEVAMPPMQQVDGAPVEAKKSRFSFLKPKISLPRILGGKPKAEAAADITPVATSATDFVPPAAAIETDTAPVNAVAPKFETPNAQIDTAALENLKAQMAAQVTAPFPGAQPPEVAPSFTAPTNPPTETAIPSPTVMGSEIVTPTPINAEAATGTLPGPSPVEEKPEAA